MLSQTQLWCCNACSSALSLNQLIVAEQNKLVPAHQDGALVDASICNGVNLRWKQDQVHSIDEALGRGSCAESYNDVWIGKVQQILRR